MKKICVIVFFIFLGTQLIPAQTLTVHSPAAGVTWYKGETKTISWTSPGCQSGNVKINIFKDSVDVANFIEQLTGPNTGSKNWTIPQNYANGNYVIRVKTDPAEDGCLGDSGVFKITEKLTFVPMEYEAVLFKSPDLKISIIPVTGPTTEINKKTLMEFKVDNIGSGASKATKMRVFMGQNNTDTWDVPIIEPGRFIYKTKEITPDWPGYILWSADVDHDNKISDTNRQNNTAHYKMIIKGPDLVVCFNTSLTAVMAVGATVMAYVRNNGVVRSSPCKLRIYMENRGGKNFDVPALDPGEKFYVQRNDIWYTLGHKTVRLTIDSGDTVPEENEKNNVVEGSIKVISALATSPGKPGHYVCSNGKSGPTPDSVW